MGHDVPFEAHFVTARGVVGAERKQPVGSQVARPKLQIHVNRVGQGIRIIGRAASEAQRLIESDRGRHVSQRIQHHALKADEPCFIEQSLCEQTSDLTTAPGRPHEQTFHLAGEAGQGSQSHATCGLRVAASQKKAPFGRRIESGQPIQLGLEPLESEVHIQLGGIFREEIAENPQVSRGRNLLDVDVAHLLRLLPAAGEACAPCVFRSFHHRSPLPEPAETREFRLV